MCWFEAVSLGTEQCFLEKHYFQEPGLLSNFVASSCTSRKGNTMVSRVFQFFSFIVDKKWTIIYNP